MATASLSWVSERSPLDGDSNRGQLSPPAALVAVATIGLALSLYATVFSGVIPGPDRNVAEPTLDRVEERVVTAGVAAPGKLTGARAVGPDGYKLHIALRTTNLSWNVGPTPPSTGSTETARRRTAVRTRPGVVRSGRLRVVVWR